MSQHHEYCVIKRPPVSSESVMFTENITLGGLVGMAG